jgi:hypothetical protein
MRKVSTAAAKQNNNFVEQKLTIGLDLGDRSSWYCVLDETGEVLLEQKLSTTQRQDPGHGALQRGCRITCHDGRHRGVSEYDDRRCIDPASRLPSLLSRIIRHRLARVRRAVDCDS